MKVTLIARTELIDEEFPELIHIDSGLELLAAKCGKNCTGKFDECMDYLDVEKFNNLNVNKLKHDSLLEHFQFTFRIQDVSRALTHQLVRHRHLSFTQTSQRYTSVLGSDNPLDNVVIPDKFKENDDAMIIFAGAIGVMKHAYEELRDLGFKKEDCRAISPQCHKTDIIVSANARALKDFFKLRLWGKGVQSEIKELAKRMYDIVSEYGNFFDEVWSK